MGCTASTSAARVAPPPGPSGGVGGVGGGGGGVVGGSARGLIAAVVGTLAGGAPLTGSEASAPPTHLRATRGGSDVGPGPSAGGSTPLVVTPVLSGGGVAAGGGRAPSRSDTATSHSRHHFKAPTRTAETLDFTTGIPAGPQVSTGGGTGSLDAGADASAVRVRPPLAAGSGASAGTPTSGAPMSAVWGAASRYAWQEDLAAVRAAASPSVSGAGVEGTSSSLALSGSGGSLLVSTRAGPPAPAGRRSRGIVTSVHTTLRPRNAPARGSSSSPRTSGNASDSASGRVSGAASSGLHGDVSSNKVPPGHPHLPSARRGGTCPVVSANKAVLRPPPPAMAAAIATLLAGRRGGVAGVGAISHAAQPAMPSASRAIAPPTRRVGLSHAARGGGAARATPGEGLLSTLIGAHSNVSREKGGTSDSPLVVAASHLEAVATQIVTPASTSDRAGTPAVPALGSRSGSTTGTGSLDSHLRLVLDAAPTGLLIADGDGNILLANTTLELMFGYAQDALVGMPVEALLPPDVARHHADLRRGFLADPHARLMGAGRALQGARLDGSTFAVEVGLNPVAMPDGSMLVMTSVADASNKAAEDNAFRQVVQAAPTALLVVGPEGDVTLANTAAERLFGVPQADLVGAAVATLLPAEEAALHSCLRDALAVAATPSDTEQTWMLEAGVTRSDGTRCPVDASVSLMGDSTSILVSLVDTTERPRLDNNFRTVVDAAPSGLIMTDSDGTILLVNAALCTQFGYTAEELVGQKVEVLMPPEVAASHVAVRSAFVASGSNDGRPMGAGRDLYGRRKDGAVVPIEIGLTSVETPDGIVVLASVVDITERRNVERLRRDVEAAERQSAAARMYLSTMSHEVRTPLMGVMGNLDLLSYTRLDGEQAEIVGTLRRCADAMLTCLGNALDFSRLDAGVMGLAHTTFDPNDLLSELSAVLAPAAAAKGIQWEVEAVTPVPHSVLGDPSRLRQVLLHLTSNAIKFTEAGRVRTTLACRPLPVHGFDPGAEDAASDASYGSSSSGRVAARGSTSTFGSPTPGSSSASGSELRHALELTFTVADTGPGIPAAALPTIFQPFSQVDMSTTRRVGGTGLGLAIAKGIVALMGGHLTVTSEVGVGSTFVATVLVDAPAAGGDTPTSISSGRPLAATHAPSGAGHGGSRMRHFVSASELVVAGLGRLDSKELAATSAVAVDSAMANAMRAPFGGGRLAGHRTSGLRESGSGGSSSLAPPDTDPTAYPSGAGTTALSGGVVLHAGPPGTRSSLVSLSSTDFPTGDIPSPVSPATAAVTAGAAGGLAADYSSNTTRLPLLTATRTPSADGGESGRDGSSMGGGGAEHLHEVPSRTELRLAVQDSLPRGQSLHLTATMRGAHSIEATHSAGPGPGMGMGVSGGPGTTSTAPPDSRDDSLGATRMIVAEDDPVTQRLVVRLLGKLAVDVVAANNGAEVVAAVRTGAFDGVLMDCEMPVLDGFGATAAVRAAGTLDRCGERRLPIMAMTANAAVGDRARCLAAGMDDFQAKPFRLRELAALLQDNIHMSPATAAAVDAVLGHPAPASPALFLPGSSPDLAAAPSPPGTLLFPPLPT